MSASKKIRTRFAPSPTGYMHVGGLRTALYAFLIAKKAGGTFILRIEDTDRARYVEGATEVIIKTLRDTGLIYDEGPDTGGPFGPYTQSERRDLYKPYAEDLCGKEAAYYCFCQSGEHFDADPCRDLPFDAAKRRAESGEPHVIRMKAPREGETKLHDMVFGEITVSNDTLDDMILIKSDGMPTYNFANVIDDHLMEITHVVRGSEYISSAPKYNILYQALGWEIPAYITVSPIMRDEHHKLSKRDGDPTYDDLLAQGYIPEAVLNYIALLGWSPGGEREIFSLDELIDIFDIKGISKAPAIFDIAKLTHFSGEYIRQMTPETFANAAEPYIRKIVTKDDADIEGIAGILQTRCEKLTDIYEKIDFFEKLPDYETSLFIHEKSKSDESSALKMLQAAIPVLESLTEWTKDAIHGILSTLAGDAGVKNATLMWPVRIAAAGKAVTPGGATEICAILGREETLSRLRLAVSKLSEITKQG